MGQVDGVRESKFSIYMKGPWALDPECPGHFHNSVRAGRGRNQPRGKNQSCVCPRSQALLVEDNEKKRVLQPKQRPERYAPKNIDGLTYMKNVLLRNIPDLSGGACFTVSGQRVMATLINGGSKPSISATNAAKKMCGGCPVRERCGQWALLAEDPPGTWEGMYGGLMPDERIAIAVQQQKEKEEREAA